MNSKAQSIDVEHKARLAIKNHGGPENRGFGKSSILKALYAFTLFSPEKTHLSFMIQILCLDAVVPLAYNTSHHTVTMARSSAGQSKAYSVAKSLRQKRDRRKISLEKKSHEYSNKCGADVCLGIRIRESGKVFIFFADTSGFWSFLGPHLVCTEKLCS